MTKDKNTAQKPIASDPAPAKADVTQPQNQALQEAQKKIAELTDVAKRAMADLQNFKRRTEEERAGLIVFANLTLLQGIFPVIDNFGRAFQHIPKELRDHEWVKGVYAIEKQFMDTLKTLGLEEIDCTVGINFNPHQHEVVLQAHGGKDTVLECLEKGYQFKGQVVRPAKVKVGNGEVS